MIKTKITLIIFIQKSAAPLFKIKKPTKFVGFFVGI